MSGALPVLTLRGLEAERLTPWCAFQHVAWFSTLMEAHVAGLPEAERGRDAALLHDVLPQIGEGEGAGGDSAGDFGESESAAAVSQPGHSLKGYAGRKVFDSPQGPLSRAGSASSSIGSGASNTTLLPSANAASTVTMSVALMRCKRCPVCGSCGMPAAAHNTRR